MKKISLLLVFMFSVAAVSLSAQDHKPYGETEEDSIACLENLSLYYESYKQKDYEAAYEPWLYSFINCPGSKHNLYIRGSKIVKFRIDNEEDSLTKERLVDTLMMVYEDRLKYWGTHPSSSEGVVAGYKALDIQRYRPKEVEAIYNLTTKSVELLNEETNPNVVIINMYYTTIMAKKGLIDSSEIIINYVNLSSILAKNLESATTERDSAKVLSAAKRTYSYFKPFSECEKLIEIFEPMFAENPNDTLLLSQITGVLQAQDCTESELYFNAATALYEISPTASSAFALGLINVNKKNYSEAAEYLKDAFEGFENIDNKFNAALLLVESYKGLGQYSTARQYAYDAIEIKPESGKPYILIGDLYAATASSCGSDEIGKKAAYWAAVDKYYKAKSVDPSVSDLANQKIGAYTAAFPKKERLFMNSTNVGDPYTVGCWINESTTVRSAD